MKTAMRLAAAATAAILTVGQAGAEDAGAAAPPHRAVLVELFTSQGCSSCPPADRILTRLGAEGPAVVPLAFHVDYWNHGGWSDPFSKHAWSARQEEYVRRFKLDAEYTPQAVVDGARQLVGSRETELRTAIADAAARPAADLSIGLEHAGDRVVASVRVDLPEALGARKLDLMVALFETGLVTDVGSGENGGHVLHDDYVVRTLVRGAKLEAGGPARTEHAVPLRVERGWDPSRLGVAAFLQDPKTLEIFGAASRPVSGAGGASGAP